MKSGSPHEFFPRLGDFLSEREEQITGEWLQVVREDGNIESSEGLTEPQLIDHLPDVFSGLCEQLHHPKDENVKGEAGSDARVHGRHRWEQGYSLEELLRELMLFRFVLAKHVAAWESHEPAFTGERKDEAFRLIHRFLDELAWRSTQRFVEHQQAKLVVVNETLRKSDEARARQTRHISHELRNVLNGLSLTAQELEMVEPAELSQPAEIFRGHIAHMAELLDDLNEWEAFASGQAKVRTSRFAPEKVAREVAAAFRPMAENKGLSLTLHVEPELDEVLCDERKVFQILTNLVTNAIKYTDQGGLTVTVGSEAEDEWMICVQDTGVGIGPEEQKSIFSEFYRVEKTASARGLGLGLSIVLKLVELLHGRIAVESQPLRGSKFTVTLPRTHQV